MLLHDRIVQAEVIAAVDFAGHEQTETLDADDRRIGLEQVAQRGFAGRQSHGITTLHGSVTARPLQSS